MTELLQRSERTKVTRALCNEAFSRTKGYWDGERNH